MSTQHQADVSAKTHGPSPWSVALWLGGGTLGVGLVLGLAWLSDDVNSVTDWVYQLSLLAIGGTSIGSYVNSKRAAKQTNGSLDARLREQIEAVLTDNGLIEKGRK